MSESPPDDDLDALFARQRAADHEQAPAFHPLCESDPVTKPAPSFVWRWAWPAVAAATGLALAATLLWHPRAKDPAVSREAVVREIAQIDTALRKSLAAQHDLTAWQSPTDFLLQPIQTKTP